MPLDKVRFDELAAIIMGAAESASKKTGDPSIPKVMRKTINEVWQKTQDKYLAELAEKIEKAKTENKKMNKRFYTVIILTVIGVVLVPFIFSATNYLILVSCGAIIIAFSMLPATAAGIKLLALEAEERNFKESLK